MKELKTLALNGNQYEIVDATAREEIKNLDEKLSQSGQSQEILPIFWTKLVIRTTNVSIHQVVS